MTKRIRKILVCLLLGCFLVSGCSVNKEEPKPTTFFDISWTREASHDVETIRFNSNGLFTYSCACGNPVNDADVVDGYEYNEETGIITLNYLEITEDAVEEVKVVEFDGDTLTLDFDGDIRKFNRE